VKRSKLPTSKRRTKGLFVHREGADVKIINGLSLLLNQGWRATMGHREIPELAGSFYSWENDQRWMKSSNHFRYLVHGEFQSSILTNSRNKKGNPPVNVGYPPVNLDIESVCLGKLSYSPKLKIMFGHLRDVSSMLEHVKKWHGFQDWKIPRKKNICIYNYI
jgi:hypothetical protein